MTRRLNHLIECLILGLFAVQPLWAQSNRPHEIPDHVFSGFEAGLTKLGFIDSYVESITRKDSFEKNPSQSTFSALDPDEGKAYIIRSLHPNSRDAQGNFVLPYLEFAHQHVGTLSAEARRLALRDLFYEQLIARDPIPKAGDAVMMELFEMATEGDPSEITEVLCSVADKMRSKMPTMEERQANVAGHSLASTYYGGITELIREMNLSEFENTRCEMSPSRKKAFVLSSALLEAKPVYDRDMVYWKKVLGVRIFPETEEKQIFQPSALDEPSFCDGSQLKSHFGDLITQSQRWRPGVRTIIVIHENDCRIDGVFSRTKDGFFEFHKRRAGGAKPLKMRFANLTELVTLFKGIQSPLREKSKSTAGADIPTGRTPPSGAAATPGSAFYNPLGDSGLRFGTR